MEIISKTFSQVQKNYKSLSIILILSVLFLSIFKIVNSLFGVPMSTMTRDVTALAKVPFYYGILSQFGIIFWAMAGVICFLFYNILKKKKRKKFFVASFVITLILCLDDAFLLHEEVLPNILGIPELMVYFAYFAIMGGYVLLFYKTILKTNFIYFLMAIGFFAFSMLVDKFFSWHHLFEDGSKFIGIVCWLVYFYSTGIKSLKLKRKTKS